MGSRGWPKYRKPLCAKCADRGHMTEFEHPGRGPKAGMIRWVPCPKNCAASQRWRAEQAAKAPPKVR